MANKFHQKKSSIKPPKTGQRGNTPDIGRSDVKTANWPGLPGKAGSPFKTRDKTPHGRPHPKAVGVAHNPLQLLGLGSGAGLLGVAGKVLPQVGTAAVNVGASPAKKIIEPFLNGTEDKFTRG